MKLSSTSFSGFEAWTMASPTPSHIDTWPGYCTRSPATAVDWSRPAAALICEPLWWAISRPARPQANAVRPEQSKPTAGSDVA